MNYTVKQLADLAGVTVRTLHHYDEIGLLNPAEVKNNGYRIYTKEELLRLQQILFYRELEFSLEEIKRILDDPSFDRKTSLSHQKTLLELKKERLAKLIESINERLATDSSVKDPEALYNPFKDDEVKRYMSEVKLRWGKTDAYQQSQKRVGKMTNAQMDKVKEEMKILARKIAGHIGNEVSSPEVQTLIQEHYDSLRAFYEPNLEMYEGLAKIYVQDPRFKKYYEEIKPGLAKFISDAMQEFIKQKAPC